MTRIELKQLAKQQIQGNLGKLFVVYLILAVVSGISSFIPGIGWLAAVACTPACLLGFHSVYLSLCKGQPYEIVDIFKGFDAFARALWLWAQITIFTLLWSLLFYIPGIVKSLSYSMSYFILSEKPHLTASECLQESKRIMHGHKAELFVLLLSFLGWGLLTAFTCGLVGIYAIPYMQATLTNFYMNIREQAAYTPDGPTLRFEKSPFEE